MNDPEPEPIFQRNLAPDLPHFGKHFRCHGPSGILTLRIDIQQYTHDGLVMIGGTVVRGTETYPTGVTQDQAGTHLSVFVTESQYMRLSNAPLGRP